MKFSEFYIGMPVVLKSDIDTCGVIVKYCGNIDGVYYVNIDIGKYELEFSLDELITAQGNV